MPLAKKRGRPKSILTLAYAQEIDIRNTSFGLLTYVKIRRHDEKPMSWPEICAVFNDRYPGRWALQCFPPADQVVDESNTYHLYVLGEEPRGMNIRRR